MEKHFKWEMLRLTWDEWSRKLVTDKFITNFANGFKGSPHDERGLLDAGPPDWYVQEYLALEKKQSDTSGTFTLNASGIGCNINPDTGDLIMQGQQGNMVVSKADLIQLVAGIMKGGPEPMPVQGTSQAQNNTMMPEHKRRMERNLQEMERWAIASSKAYPRNT